MIERARTVSAARWGVKKLDPLIPAQAGIQGPFTRDLRLWPLGPRRQGDERSCFA